jgi:hypothetical protein
MTQNSSALAGRPCSARRQAGLLTWIKVAGGAALG